MSFFFKKRKEVQDVTPPPAASQTSTSEGHLQSDGGCDDDDLFGDMVLDFSPPTTTNTTHEETSHQDDQSNLDQLKDLVLTDDTAIENQTDKADQTTNDIQQQQHDSDNHSATTTTENDDVITNQAINETENDHKEEDSTTITSTVGVSDTTSIVPGMTSRMKPGKKTKKRRLPGSANKQRFESETNTKDVKSFDGKDISSQSDKPVPNEVEEKVSCGVTMTVADSSVTTEPVSNKVIGSVAPGRETRDTKEEVSNESTQDLKNNINLNESEVELLVNKIDNKLLHKEKEKTVGVGIPNDSNDKNNQDKDHRDLFDDDMVLEFDGKLTNDSNTAIVIPATATDEVSKQNKVAVVDTKIASIAPSDFGEKDGDENSSNDFSMELLNENDKFHLTVETLKMKYKDLRDIADDFDARCKASISDWYTCKVDIDSIPGRLKSLQETQQKLAEEDDFDRAACIEQETRDLIQKGEHFKYQHPLLNEKISQIVIDFKEHNACYIETKDQLLISIQETLSVHEDRLKFKEETVDQEYQQEELSLKEEKLALDRKLSHLALDNEHLLKNKEILDGEIEKKTSVLLTERQDIVEKQTSVQDKIKELEEELRKLRDQDTSYTEKITKIDVKIEDIAQEFQPRLNKIEVDQIEIGKEETNATNKMTYIDLKIEEIAERKHKVHEILKRDKSTLEELDDNIDQLKRNSLTMNEEDSTFSLDDVIDLQSFIKTDEEDLAGLKVKVTDTETKYQTIFDEVLSDKSRLKSLQRSIKELETQLSELQKSKKNAIKERKYKDAQRLSDEIKHLTVEGESNQREVLQIEQSLKIHEEKMKILQNEIDVNQQEYGVKLKEFDCTIVKQLLQTSEKINTFLTSNSNTWFRKILELQLSTNEEIINTLTTKHGFAKEEEEEEESHEVMNEKIFKLEQQLEIAEEEENWDLAEELNNEIIKIKAKQGT